ncbi:MAG: hypothetical protein IPM54_10800 [Polyangiaceae bacterium]|nr:hypothetical protein [Polyangiaceae bacterium]
MEMPMADTSADAYLPKSTYTVSRVAADPKTAGLEAVHTSIKTTLRERDDLEEQAQKKAALLDADDEACDDIVEEFELHLLGAVKKNRDNLKYKRYFADGLRAVTAAESREEEPKIVADILESMAEDENDPEIGAVVTQWKSKLAAARAKVIAMVESLGNDGKGHCVHQRQEAARADGNVARGIQETRRRAPHGLCFQSEARRAVLQTLSEESKSLQASNARRASRIALKLHKAVSGALSGALDVHNRVEQGFGASVDVHNSRERSLCVVVTL